MAWITTGLIPHFLPSLHRFAGLLADTAPAAPAMPTTTGQYALWGVISSLVVFPILSFGERQYQKLNAAHEAERVRIDAAHQAEKLRIDATHQEEKLTLVNLVKSATDDNRKVHQRLGEIEQHLKGYETQVTSLTQKVASLETTNLALAAENRSLRNMVRNLQQRNNDLANEVTVLRADLAHEHATRVSAQEESGRLKIEVNLLLANGTAAGQPERYPVTS